MTSLFTGFRLALRSSTVAFAIGAALICGLGSAIMQELAQGQQQSLRDQRQFIAQVQSECRTTRCLSKLPDLAGVEQYARDTNRLVARAAPLQTLEGSVIWAQGWLVTGLGLIAVMAALSAVVTADVESGRYIAGWHPARRSRGPLKVALVAGFVSALAVALGAFVGAATGAVAGQQLWALPDAPVAGVGDVAISSVSLGWLPGWLSAVLAGVMLAWFIPRVLPALTIGVVMIIAAALSAGLLPSWFPFVQLPALSGAWLHHRGEVAQVWQWGSTQPQLLASDWSSLAATNPYSSALAGMVGLAVVLAVVAVPLAARHPPE